MLPQGLNNSPTLFGNVLAKELEQWQDIHQNTMLLQYVDDTLIGGGWNDDCLKATINLLNFFCLAG